MPFGLLAASFTFQRLMSEILEPYLNFCVAYINDILIFDGSLEEHIKHVDEVRKCLQENNITVKPFKVQLCQTEVQFLEHIIGYRFKTPNV